MATRKKKAAGPTPVEATAHTEASRLNIPTAELESFAREAEREPKKLQYPRDTTLDPQLVWRGKDEQDSKNLEVPAAPIYIQETIEPRSLIEDLRVHSMAGQDAEQISFFDSYEGLDFGDKVDFYQHSGKWANRMILGDSLLVMASLADKEGLKSQVQMIYIDPPYGIKFGSNWQVSTRNREVKDGRSEDAIRQPEQIRAFRDTWELGIHSYLAYLRDRLVVARDLLTPSGSVFVQIGDENVHLVRSVMDEVFGADCHVVTILVKKKGAQKSSLIDPVNDYLLWYSKSSRSGSDPVGYHALWEPRELDADTLAEFRLVELEDGRTFPLANVPGPDGKSTEYRLRPNLLQADHPGARLFRPWPITNGGERANQMDPIEFEGKEYRPPKGYCWRHTSRSPTGLSGMERLKLADRLMASGRSLDYKRYLDDFPYKILSNWWDGLGGAANPVYVVQTNTEIIKRCILMTTSPGDLVLDPTCGSGTTAVVAEEWGRRWITTDTSRVALALARTRVMAARFPYYILADSSEGATKESELTGLLPATTTHGEDIRKGFVCHRQSRITSGAFANSPDIKEGMTREEIESAVARHADIEVLHDRPYEDKKTLRVTGPFTVESLSPHRVLLDGTEDETRTTTALSEDAGRFAEHILDNLRRSGVQNTVKDERLEFDLLESWPGIYIQAQGGYKEGGKNRTAAVCIGPEHGTVGTELVREAAKEAARAGADVLIVCGFAFEPLVADEARQFGRLTVLNAKMNPDLQMPDLLKKTGAGNLFMVFGEPDIDVRSPDDDRIQVEIRGIDVYDPTTGQVRSHSTDDIACWFIDTDYNGESFFVRHAYFSGGDDPYEKLKRALKADIDEEAWASLYSTASRPFAKPNTGKIAIKVINHYGDEVMKVYEA